VACVTAPAAAAGRGQKPVEPPVAVAARSLGLEVIQTRDVNSLSEQLRQHSLDATVVVAFGQILSPAILALPRLGAFNVHFSLLPQYRGAAPVQRALLAGEKTTGVTVMAMNPEVDAGDILLQEACSIQDYDNCLTLKTKLAWLGADLLLRALALAETGALPRQAQLASTTPRATKLKKKELLIDWEQPAERIWGLVRAAAPLPGAFTYLGGKRTQVLQGRPLGMPTAPALPGEIISCLKDGILVASGEGGFLLQEVKPEGRKRMAAVEFLRGTNITPGDRLNVPRGGQDG